MTLSLPGMDVGQRTREDHDASQWFTPMPIARRMVAWAGAIKPLNILEPSSGSGNLVEAARERWPSAHIDAVELDGFYARRLREWRDDSKLHVYHADFLDFRPPFDDLYDLCIANTPYEDGLDGRFLAHAMDLSERVIALVRLAALAGQARHEDVWSRCLPDGDFAMRSLAIFSKRPRFEPGRAIGDRDEEGSARADFAVVKLSRRAEHERGREFPGFVEWWTP